MDLHAVASLFLGKEAGDVGRAQCVRRICGIPGEDNADAAGRPE